VALTIGELVGFIRFDPSGVDEGADRAEDRMRQLGDDMGDAATTAGQTAGQNLGDGIVQGADGRLRDASGRFVTQGQQIGDDVGDAVVTATRGRLRGLVDAFTSAGNSMADAFGGGVARGADEASARLLGVGRVIMGLSVAPPVVAAITTALGSLAAGAVAAGIAVKAFSLAAKPQMEAVEEVTTAAEAAEKAHEQAALKAAAAQKLKAKGGDEYKKAQQEANAATDAAKQADAAYKQQLDQLPGPTREYALALQGLKEDHDKWSESLSGTTMPVFTKGIQILRDLLPTLTPFVKGAAEAFGSFLDEVAVGVKSAGFKQWAADMGEAAGPALKNFLDVIKNLAIGFGGLLQAFLPTSSGVTGGLVDMSAAFRDWATSLKGSEGFDRFIEMARNGGGALAELGKALGNLLVAAAPLFGTFGLIANALAEVINNTPTPVLTALAYAITGVVLASKAWSIGSALVTTANRLMASSTYTAIAGWTRMMATGLMAYARLGAAAVASAARTAAAWIGSALASMGTFLASLLRTAATAVATYAMMAARAMAMGVRMAAAWVVGMGPIGWVIAAVVALVALIIANWDKVKQWTAAAWDWIWGKIKGVAQWLLDLFMNWTLIGVIIQNWDKIVAATKAAWDWVKNAVMTVVNWILSHVKSSFDGIKNAISTAWNAVKTITQAAWNVIKALLQGAWNAIKSLVSGAINSVKSTMSNAWNAIKSITSSIWNGIKSAISNALSSARSLASNAVNAIKGFFSSGFNAVKSTVSNAISGVVSTIRGLGSRVRGAVSGAAQWLVSAGKSIIQGLINGIKSMGGAVGDAVKGVLSGARDLLPFSPAKKGPFAGKGWTLYSGRSIMDALAKGIAQRKAKVAAATRKAMIAAKQEQLFTKQSTAFQTGQQVRTTASGSEMPGVQNGYGGKMLNIEHYYESDRGSAKDTALELEWLARARG
jgi:phage-related protein